MAERKVDESNAQPGDCPRVRAELPTIQRYLPKAKQKGLRASWGSVVLNFRGTSESPGLDSNQDILLTRQMFYRLYASPVGHAMELRGFEPRTVWLPAKCSPD